MCLPTYINIFFIGKQKHPIIRSGVHHFNIVVRYTNLIKYCRQIASNGIITRGGDPSVCACTSLAIWGALRDLEAVMGVEYFSRTKNKIKWTNVQFF